MLHYVESVKRAFWLVFSHPRQLMPLVR